MSTDASRSSRSLLNAANMTLPFTNFSQYPPPAGAPAPAPPIATFGVCYNMDDDGNFDRQ
jgi:hypothetical protein